MKLEEYKKILLDAIDKEVDAYAFYISLSEKVKDSALKTVFQDLAKEETYHRKTLQEYLNGTRKQLKFDEVKDYHLSDLIEKPKPSMDLKPLEGLQVAIKREEEAMQMYENFAAASIDPDQKKVFEELAKMERGHKVRLEDIYTNSAFAEAW
jgi:rubrerythrin